MTISSFFVEKKYLVLIIAALLLATTVFVALHTGEWNNVQTMFHHQLGVFNHHSRVASVPQVFNHH